MVEPTNPFSEVERWQAFEKATLNDLHRQIARAYIKLLLNLSIQVYESRKVRERLERTLTIN